MASLFITSSGTDIGKTFVTCLLTAQLRRAGRVAVPYKPVISGWDAANADDSDTVRLLHAAAIPLSDTAIDCCSPWRFSAPLSPHMAAALENKHISMNELIRHSQSVVNDSDDITLIEGVGGVMVPITPEQTVLDWLRPLNIPTIVVVGSYLGSISHSLTALHALENAGISISGVVVSESVDGVSLADTAASLRPYLPDSVPIIPLPRMELDATQKNQQDMWDDLAARAPDLTVMLS